MKRCLSLFLALWMLLLVGCHGEPSLPVISDGTSEEGTTATESTTESDTLLPDTTEEDSSSSPDTSVTESDTETESTTPEATTPEVTEPETTEPETTEPETTKPETTKPETTKPETTKPTTTKPETTKPETTKPETTKEPEEIPPEDVSLSAGDYVLNLTYQNKGWRLSILSKKGKVLFRNDTPAVIRSVVAASSSVTTTSAPYQSVELKKGYLTCTATVTTERGAAFRVVDVYCVQNDAFLMDRTVTVTTVCEIGSFEMKTLQYLDVIRTAKQILEGLR